MQTRTSFLLVIYRLETSHKQTMSKDLSVWMFAVCWLQCFAAVPTGPIVEFRLIKHLEASKPFMHICHPISGAYIQRADCDSGAGSWPCCNIKLAAQWQPDGAGSWLEGKLGTECECIMKPFCRLRQLFVGATRLSQWQRVVDHKGAAG